MINGHGAERQRRQKHAWFLVVRRMEKYLFRTLDEESERELKGLIGSNANSTQTVSKLLAKQTDIVVNEFANRDQKVSDLESMVPTIETTTN